MCLSLVCTDLVFVQHFEVGLQPVPNEDDKTSIKHALYPGIRCSISRFSVMLDTQKIQFFTSHRLPPTPMPHVGVHPPSPPGAAGAPGVSLQVLPAPGGDLIRDGAAVLPTGRNIHALDPYRIPSAARPGVWAVETRQP